MNQIWCFKLFSLGGIKVLFSNFDDEGDGTSTPLFEPNFQTPLENTKKPKFLLRPFRFKSLIDMSVSTALFAYCLVFF